MSQSDKERLRSQFEAERGYWSPFWGDLLDASPEFFEAFLNFSAVPWRSGPLDPKTKELIYIAINVATTHLYEPGLRVHIRNALKYGASEQEIFEVFQLVSVMGMHSMILGMPVLKQELQASKSPDAG